MFRGTLRGPSVLPRRPLPTPAATSSAPLGYAALLCRSPFEGSHGRPPQEREGRFENHSRWAVVKPDPTWGLRTATRAAPTAPDSGRPGLRPGVWCN